MNELALTIFVLLVLLLVTNLSSIIMMHYTIKSDVDDIQDDKIKAQLVNSLQPIWRIFLKGLIYHGAEDHFTDRGHYNQYMIVINSESFNLHKQEVDLFHRHPEPEIEWDFTSFAKRVQKEEEERELEVEVIKD